MLIYTTRDPNRAEFFDDKEGRPYSEGDIWINELTDSQWIFVNVPIYDITISKWLKKE